MGDRTAGNDERNLAATEKKRRLGDAETNKKAYPTKEMPTTKRDRQALVVSRGKNMPAENTPDLAVLEESKFSRAA